MDTSEIIIRKTVFLPAHLKQEVIDFIDFLISKYGITEVEEDKKVEEYNLMLSKLLAMRSSEAKKNPENVLTSEQSRQIIIEKYKWHEQV